jgi:hypothetical protein
MPQRRTFAFGLGCAVIATATAGIASRAWAQPPARPIALPPRPGNGQVPGRFQAGAGVASGALPGVYVVVDVDAGAETLRLRDVGGQTEVVHVRDSVFDLGALKPGDQVEVDFLVPEPGRPRLEAGGLWKVQP